MINFMEIVQTCRGSRLAAILSCLCISWAVVICLYGLAVADISESGDGTLFDSGTGLMWQQDADATGRCWEDAWSYCNKLSLGGHNDWRLPDLKELKSISDTTKLRPAIISPFKNTQSAGYWTSTTCTFDPTRKRYVNFLDGVVGTSAKSDALYTRCTRKLAK